MMTYYTGCEIIQERYIFKWNDSIQFHSLGLGFECYGCNFGRIYSYVTTCKSSPNYSSYFKSKKQQISRIKLIYTDSNLVCISHKRQSKAFPDCWWRGHNIDNFGMSPFDWDFSKPIFQFKFVFVTPLVIILYI